MSNPVYIGTEKVENIVTGKIVHQISIQDSYGYAILEIVDSEIPENDIEALDMCIKKVFEENEIASEILNSAIYGKKGFNINGTWYDWEEVSHLFEQIYDVENERENAKEPLDEFH